jgi:hypothetical protein
MVQCPYLKKISARYQYLQIRFKEILGNLGIASEWISQAKFAQNSVDGNVTSPAMTATISSET